MEGDHPKNMLTCPSIINLFRENTSQRISVKVRIMAYKVIYILIPGTCEYTWIYTTKRN